MITTSLLETITTIITTRILIGTSTVPDGAVLDRAGNEVLDRDGNNVIVRN